MINLLAQSWYQWLYDCFAYRIARTPHWFVIFDDSIIKITIWVFVVVEFWRIFKRQTQCQRTRCFIFGWMGASMLAGSSLSLLGDAAVSHFVEHTRSKGDCSPCPKKLSQPALNTWREPSTFAQNELWFSITDITIWVFVIVKMLMRQTRCHEWLHSPGGCAKVACPIGLALYCHPLPYSFNTCYHRGLGPFSCSSQLEWQDESNILLSARGETGKRVETRRV